MKKIIASLAVAFMAFATQASYLYWQVDNSAYDAEYNSAILWGNNDNGTKTQIAQITTPDTFSIDSGWNYVSYYVELLNYTSATVYTSVGQSNTYTYSQIQEFSNVNLDVPTIPPMWTGGGTGPSYNAPEPTSAMLMLIGMAGLALKRRKA